MPYLMTTVLQVLFYDYGFTVLFNDYSFTAITLAKICRKE